MGKIRKERIRKVQRAIDRKENSKGKKNDILNLGNGKANLEE